MKRLELQCPEMYAQTGACRAHLILTDFYEQETSVIHCDPVKNANTVLNEYSSKKCIS